MLESPPEGKLVVRMRGNCNFCSILDLENQQSADRRRHQRRRDRRRAREVSREATQGRCERGAGCERRSGQLDGLRSTDKLILKFFAASRPWFLPGIVL